MKLPNIPKHWSWKCVNELGTDDRPAVKAGPFGSSLKKEVYVESGYRVYGQEQVIAGDLSFGNYYIDQRKFESLKSCSVRTGDILISLVGTFGKILVVPKEFEPGIINPRLVRLSLDSEKIDPYFFLRFFESPLALLQMELQSHGGTMGILNAKNISELFIPLPPLEEQRRIAAILDQADGVRRKRKEAIALTEELLRSAFLDMFGDPVTNPKGWEVKDLGSQVAELRYGTSVKCSDDRQNEALPVLRIPNIIGEKIEWGDLKYATLDKKEVEKLTLKAGDILFVRTNGNPEYIGRCALFESGFKNSLYASYLIRARLREKSSILPSFLRDIVSFPTYRNRLVREARTTAGNYNISTAGLSRLRLICPPLEMQERYLDISRQVSESYRKFTFLSAENENLFNSLLQRAFRGEL